MSRETVLHILERAYHNLDFRRELEQTPDAILSSCPDLSSYERELLARYPKQWLAKHSVQRCPICQAPTVVSRNGLVFEAPKCGHLAAGRLPLPASSMSDEAGEFIS